MGAPRTLREINAALVVLEARRITRLRGSYGRQVVGPLRNAIAQTPTRENAETPKAVNEAELRGLLGRLDAGLYRQMDTAELEGELADQEIQAGLIGRTAARPRGNAETQKRRNAESREAKDDAR